MMFIIIINEMSFDLPLKVFYSNHRVEQEQKE